MTEASKREYLRIMSQRYQTGCRKEKHLILDELEKNLTIHRKSAIRAVNSIKVRRPKEARGRRRVYNDFVIQHLKKLWLEMGQLCSRRMKKALPHWLRHVEADTVHHCGGALSGVSAITLTVTDIWTSWTECRALWGLSMKGVTECMSDIEKYLPFRINEVSVDNGSKFLNYEFTRYFQLKIINKLLNKTEGASA